HVAGKEGVDIARASARGTEDILVMAARKGDRGTAWLRNGGQRLLRPHPLIGLFKGVRKGNVQRAAAQLARGYDPHGWLVIAGCALWVFLESAWLWKRLTARTPQLRVESGLARAA